MEETLLKKFIKEKINNYVEPKRQGTPRGEPIGFSMVKYKASLLMITNKKQKKIAKELGISYGLLRKWNTERTFKAMVERHYTEFTEFLLKYGRERQAQYGKEWKEYLEKPIEEIANTRTPEMFSEEFTDSKLYNSRLIKKIMDTITEVTEKENGYSVNRIIGMVKAIWGSHDEPPEPEEERGFKTVVKRTISDVKKVLLKPNFTKRDKKLAMLHLKILEDFIKTWWEFLD